MDPKKTRYYTYIRPVIRNKFVRTYSSVIFSLLTIGIFSYYAIRPTVTTILSLQKSIEEQNQVLNSLKEKVNNLTQGKQNYENISPSVKNKLGSLIPDNPALPRLINSLTFAANQAEASISGIQIQSIDLQPKSLQVSKNAELKEVAFTFNTSGEFPNLMKVLTNIKRLDRLITINSINFALPNDNALVMSINAKAYFLKN